MLALLGLSLTADCPPGCCEAGDLSIARQMECCEAPAMSQRSPVSAQAALTVRVMPHVLITAADVVATQLQVEPTLRPRSIDATAPLRGDAPLFLLNAQFLI